MFTQTAGYLLLAFFAAFAIVGLWRLAQRRAAIRKLLERPPDVTRGRPASTPPDEAHRKISARSISPLCAMGVMPRSGAADSATLGRVPKFTPRSESEASKFGRAP